MYVLGMFSFSLNYKPYDNSGSTKSKVLIRQIDKRTRIPCFYLNKYCLLLKVGFDSNRQCGNLFLFILLALCRNQSWGHDHNMHRTRKLVV